MKRTLILSFFIATLTIAGCNSENKKAAMDEHQYALVELPTPDLSGITENGKEVLNLYRFAAKQVDSIYASQGDFYPEDMTDAEFDAFEDPAKNSPYTLIRRDSAGALRAIWYHDAFSARIDTIANCLTAAAQLTIKASVKQYLLSKVDALRTDDYYRSDLDWLAMDDSKMDLVIGPNEAVRDSLRGLKRSYEAFVMLKDLEFTEQLRKYTSNLPELQESLPCPAEYKCFVPGNESNIFACNAIEYAGSADDGIKVIGINLPFDERVQAEKGTRTIIFKNIIEEKFYKVIAPVGNVIVDADQTLHVDGKAFLWNTIFREVAHGLGVKETLEGATLGEALGASAPLIEEIKADIMGIYLLSGMSERHELGDLTTKSDAYTTFFVSLVRSSRYGNKNKVGISNIVCFNYLLSKGAFTRRGNGKYYIDFEKMKSAVAGLTGEILRIQATGDKAAAEGLISAYSKIGRDMEEDFMNIRLEKIPVDIRFE